MARYGDPLSHAQLRAHDRPRDLIPAQVWEEALATLRARLPVGCRVVEVGIGSGSYGGRLAAQDVDVIGVDLNDTMLRSAQHRWQHLDARLVQADATRLPIRHGAADAVLIAQVLHLIPNWYDALDESVRVLGDAGIVAISGGGGVGGSGVGRFFRSVLGDVPPLPGASDRQEIYDAVVALGGEPLDPITIEVEADQSLRDFIDRLENNPFAWHPDVDPQRLVTAGELTRADVIEHGLDLDEPRPTPVGVSLDLFAFSGR